MEDARYRPFGAGCRDLDMVTVNSHGANQMYMARSSPPASNSRSKLQVVKVGRSSKPSSKKWWNDPESKRRRRVAKYKFYSAEGKVKSSLKKGFRWFKRKVSRLVSGS